MKVLVTGAAGQLGCDVVEELESRQHEAIGVDIEQLDITDKVAVYIFIKELQPDAVIHCAAYTAVDGAEDNVDICKLVNAKGTENIALTCKEFDIPMMYISTDYVFNGEGNQEWNPEDIRNPINVYGQSKYEGELFVEKLKKSFIVRISWVFGKNGNNFVKTMLKVAKSRDSLTVVNDQIGSPTYTCDLAKLLCDMIVTDKYGKYHATNEGFCSWYEYACEIFRQAGICIKILPVRSDEYPVKAKRPKNSRMSKDKLTENGFKKLPQWNDALSRYLKELGEI